MGTLEEEAASHKQNFQHHLCSAGQAPKPPDGACAMSSKRSSCASIKLVACICTHVPFHRAEELERYSVFGDSI